jgi:hypothetical protein
MTGRENRNDLFDLIDTSDAECVLREVRHVISLIHPGYDFRSLDHVFRDIRRLFNGQYPGYKGCNTEYHDLKHTFDVLLTLARLLHGLSLEGRTVSRKMIELGLMAALMHDTGYIQTRDDSEGTGAKYTKVHVERSIDFTRKYFTANSFLMIDSYICSNIVAATHQSLEHGDIPFASDEERLMGKAIYISDFLGQMADRYYIEKLLFLYKEFVEGAVPGIGKEEDLFENTVGFSELIRKRLEGEMEYRPDYMRQHFRYRWDIDSDLYSTSVMKNIAYLKYILGCCGKNYISMLRRRRPFRDRPSHRLRRL